MTAAKRRRHPRPGSKRSTGRGAAAGAEGQSPDARPARPIVSPARAFLIVGSLLGALLVFLTPPFQVPDEPHHFYRAFQVSELPLALASLATRATPRTKLRPPVPKSLIDLVDRSDVAGTQFRPFNKVRPARFLAELRAPLNPGDRVGRQTTNYPPVPYVPQAVGIALGRLFGASPLVMFYLGRLCAVAAWVVLVFLAIRTTPILKWTYFLLALMPMTLTLAASHSVDGVVIGVSFLLSAQLLAWAYDPAKTRVTTADAVYLLLLALTLTLSKPVYLLLLALFLLVPRDKFQGTGRYLLTGAAVVGACVAAEAASSLFRSGPPAAARPGADGNSGSPLSDVSVARQFASIRANPLGLMTTLVNTFATLHTFYLNSFVGILGWLDTPLPVWLPYAYVAALIAVSLLGAGPRVSWTARGLGLAIFGLVTFISFVGIYAAFTSVGMSIVYGFQGRYFIPAAPMLFLVFHNRRLPWRMTNAVAVGLIAFVTLTTSIAGYRVVKRFYVPETPSFSIDAVEAARGGEVLRIKGWAIDRGSDGPAEAVDVELDGEYHRARYGLDRPDVAERLKKPAYRYSGFEATIYVASPGRHRLALRVVARDRSSYVIPEQRLPLLLK